jgi:hypothetical protein
MDNNKILDKQKLKQNHTSAADHYKKAAEHHIEAAKNHEAGNHEKGNSHAYMAHGHSKQAKIHGSDACCHSAGIDTKK